jgi:16S rRNA (cytosine967-C5)-methyltransferase
MKRTFRQRPAPATRKRGGPATTPPDFERLAKTTAAVASAVMHSVLQDHRRLAPSLSEAMLPLAVRSPRDRAWIARSLAALLRWWGWIELLRLPRTDEQLLLAWLLDSKEVAPPARIWAERLGRSADRLVPVGDAPNWTARAEGLKRWAQGKPVNADPWRLFPAWFRDQVPVPPGDTTAKNRRLDFLTALQSPAPVWLTVRGGDAKAAWNQLREAGHKPWIHRRITSTAKLPFDALITPPDFVETHRIVFQDLASQAVGLICDPDPGDRWWCVRGEAENAAAAIQLADLSVGKGAIICTFERERPRRDAALRFRKTPYHNITTKLWDGHRLPAKRGSFDGVLVDAHSSAVGHWRRHPDARWTTTPARIPELAASQLELLNLASQGVRPSGSLVYTVATMTRAETTEVVDAFLASHPDFTLYPFTHPFEEGTTQSSLIIWPHQYDCDGRFIARMIRSALVKTKPNASEAEAASP